MKKLILISLLLIIVSFALPVNAWNSINNNKIIGEFLKDIPLVVKERLISNSYRVPSGEILTTTVYQGIQWSLAIILTQGERAAAAADLLAVRGLFHQKIVRDLTNIAYTEDIKNDLAHYFLAHKTDYSIESIEEKKTLENNGMTAVLIRAPINGLNYQVNNFKIDNNFYQYLIFKSEFLDYYGEFNRALSRLNLIEFETDSKTLQLTVLIKKAKIYSKIGSENNVIESLSRILSYEDINLYRAYGPSEFKNLVSLLVNYGLKQEAVSMAAFALALFPEESYYEEVILSK